MWIPSGGEIDEPGLPASVRAVPPEADGWDPEDRGARVCCPESKTVDVKVGSPEGATSMPMSAPALRGRERLRAGK